MTGKPVCLATRSAVRWRVPDSVVSMRESGTSWVAARRMRVPSRSSTTAPSILHSSRTRVAENSMSSTKPPVQIESTTRSKPSTMRAPVRPRRMRSRLSRSSVPGATAAKAARSSSSSLRSITSLSARGAPSATTPVARSLDAGNDGRARCPRPGEAAHGLDGARHVTHLVGPDALRQGETTVKAAGRDERVPEAEARSLGQPALQPRHAPHLAGEPDLPERDDVGGQRTVDDRGGDGAHDGEVGGGLGQPHSTDRRREDVTGAHRRTGALVEHRDDHREAGGVEAARGAPGRGQGRRCDERLDLGHEGAAALERDGDAGACDREVAPGEEEPARVGQADDADVGEVEAADLVGGTEAVLHRADESQPRVPVTLELHDDVDEVLEDTRARDRAVLGDVSDEQHGHAALLRGADEAGRDLTDLRDVAGLTLD